MVRLSKSDTEFPFFIQVTLDNGLLVALHSKVIVLPLETVAFCGCTIILGGPEIAITYVRTRQK